MQYLFALFLLSSSCAATTHLPRLWEWQPTQLPLTVVIHEDIPLDISVEVLAAIAWWEEQTGEELFGDYGAITPGAILVVLPMPDHVDERYAGMAHKAGTTVGVYLRDGASNLPRVIRHELGHALGLPHNNDETSIMYWMAIPGEFEVTDSDMELLPPTY